MSAKQHRSHIAIRPDWLALRNEEIIDPDQTIVDAHHHLFDRPGWRYLMDDMLADTASGHNIAATVYVQGRAMLRADGPDEMRAVGETEFANGIAAMAASGIYGKTRFCEGIVGYADLLAGAEVRPVLGAHIAAGGGHSGSGRFKGIRQIAVWDPDPGMVNPAYFQPEDMLDSTAFRNGFACLAPLGLSFDAWILFHQIPHLVSLAQAFPQTPIVLDHCGGIPGIGPYAGRGDEVFDVWRKGIRSLSRCPNVMVKLGGLGMSLTGFDFDKRDHPPSSQDLAEKWRPYVETVIDAFGPQRCMFESNFPMDKGSYSYAVGWNAMKRLAQQYSPDERQDLFWRSAARFYRLSGFGSEAEVH